MFDFINVLLPDVILQIVLGFICTRVFRITYIAKQSDDYEHILIETLVIGFILHNVFLIIPFSLGSYLDTLGMIISSGIIGFLFARLLSSNIIYKICRKLKIKHTPYPYMWQNIEDPDYAVIVDVYNPETKVRFNGKLVKYEEFQRTPIIQLSHYIEWRDGTIINDVSDDKTRTVLIDTAQYSVIRVDYQDCSDFPNRWNNK